MPPPVLCFEERYTNRLLSSKPISRFQYASRPIFFYFFPSSFPSLLLNSKPYVGWRTPPKGERRIHFPIKNKILSIYVQSLTPLHKTSIKKHSHMHYVLGIDINLPFRLHPLTRTCIHSFNQIIRRRAPGRKSENNSQMHHKLG